ncbi:hypothetical protein HG530_011892 [Fusarium avenaceum]|nr:hypothetical protein HG530_011892 [Fusarium avenaceum]
MAASRNELMDYEGTVHKGSIGPNKCEKRFSSSLRLRHRKPQLFLPNLNMLLAMPKPLLHLSLPIQKAQVRLPSHRHHAVEQRPPVDGQEREAKGRHHGPQLARVHDAGRDGVFYALDCPRDALAGEKGLSAEEICVEDWVDVPRRTPLHLRPTIPSRYHDPDSVASYLTVVRTQQRDTRDEQPAWKMMPQTLQQPSTLYSSASSFIESMTALACVRSSSIWLFNPPFSTRRLQIVECAERSDALTLSISLRYLATLASPAARAAPWRLFSSAMSTLQSSRQLGLQLGDSIFLPREDLALDFELHAVLVFRVMRIALHSLDEVLELRDIAQVAVHCALETLVCYLELTYPRHFVAHEFLGLAHLPLEAIHDSDASIELFAERLLNLVVLIDGILVLFGSLGHVTQPR